MFTPANRKERVQSHDSSTASLLSQSRSSQRESVKDVPGRFVKDVMRLERMRISQILRKEDDLNG